MSKRINLDREVMRKNFNKIYEDDTEEADDL